MKLKIEAELFTPATEHGFYEIDKTVPRLVTVTIGGVSVAEVEVPAEVPYTKAGHGDDSSYFKQEDERQIIETLAPYLARLFSHE